MLISGTTGIDLAGLPINNSGNTEVEGNLNLSGVGKRITGDFSNATASNRVAFQTSTIDGNTIVTAKPNGAGTQGMFICESTSDADNCQTMNIHASTIDTKIVSAAKGTSAYVPMLFFTGGAERMRIDTAGNVGIGTTPSAWGSSWRSLDLLSSSITSYTTLTDPYTIISNNAYIYGSSSTLGSVYKNNGSANSYNQGGGAHVWRTAPSGTAGNTITWTNTMTLDANANLTLGNGIVGNHIMSRYDASYYTFIKNYTAVDATPIFENVVAGVRRSAILANGTYQSATNVYGSTSDIKLKENIVDTSPKLEKLMKVQVRNFNYIGQEDKQIGVIAQEIEQVFPGVVFETKDTKQVEVTKTRDITDEDGNVTQEEYIETETVETGEVTKNVKYSIIYMMMLKGMQEMRAEYTAEINDLKARIELLEAK